MAAGNEVEPFLLDMWRARHPDIPAILPSRLNDTGLIGTPVSNKGNTIIHPTEGFAATPDALALMPRDLVRPIEIKLSAESEGWSKEKPPIYVRHQVMWQMFILRECGIRCNKAYVFGLVGSLIFDLEVMWCDNEIKDILSHVDAFLLDAASFHESQDRKGPTPERRPYDFHDSHSLDVAIETIEALKATRKEIDARIEEANDHVRRLLGETYSFEHGGKVWRISDATHRTNYCALVSEYEELLSPTVVRSVRDRTPMIRSSGSLIGRKIK